MNKYVKTLKSVLCLPEGSEFKILEEGHSYYIGMHTTNKAFYYLYKRWCSESYTKEENKEIKDEFISSDTTDVNTEKIKELTNLKIALNSVYGKPNPKIKYYVETFSSITDMENYLNYQLPRFKNAEIVTITQTTIQYTLIFKYEVEE